MRTNTEEIVHQIKQNDDYWSGQGITPQQVELLAGLSQKDYDDVVRTFLQEPVGANENLRGAEYRCTYAHLVYGCIMSILRPNRSLYPIVLKGALGIDDPSSIHYGAYALKQMKPLEEILEDLRTVTKDKQTEERILQHVAWLLYWFGFSDKGRWTSRLIAVSVGSFRPLAIDVSLPPFDQQSVERMAGWAAEIMKLHYSDIST